MEVAVMRRDFPAKWLVLVGLIFSSAIYQNVYSQVIQTPASEEQRRRAQAEAEERQRLLKQPNVELPSQVQPESVESIQLPDETPCFKIQQLRLLVPSQLPDYIKKVGASTLPLDPFFFAQEYVQRYTGKCIGQNGLGLITQRLSALILQRGYSTTRIGLAEQDLSQGILTFTLVPGVIRVIRFSDPSLYGTWRNAFPAKSGQLLNLRDLEQGLEQMKRVSNQDVEMQIVPGDVPGESDILLTVQRSKPWKISASLDNSGAKGTGQLQAGGNLAIDNLLGLSDLFNVGINTDADRRKDQHGTSGHNIYYAIPFGYSYISVAASDNEYFQQIAGNNSTYVSSGKSQNLDIKSSTLFHRDQTQKNSVQFNIGKRWSHAFIDDTELDVQKRNVTYVELGWLHKHYIGNAQLDVTLSNRWGASLFGSQQDVVNRPVDYPTFNYTIQTVDATFSAPFQFDSQSFSYMGTLRGQTSRSPLYLSEQFSIGGRYTVRGFDGELTLAAERGFYLRNELNMPIFNAAHSVYSGFDIGKVYGPSVEYLVGDKLAGATLGIRGSLSHFSYDLFSSWPMYRPEQFKTSTPTVGFNLSIQY